MQTLFFSKKNLANFGILLSGTPHLLNVNHDVMFNF